MKTSSYTFPKRKDIYRKYRSEISKDAINALDPYNSDKRLLKAKKDINNIDPNILKNLNLDISLSKGNEVNIDFSSDYKLLNFELDDIDQAKLNELNNQLEKIINIKNSNFILDNDNQIIKSEIENDKNNEASLQDLENKINEVSVQIQNFPQTAHEDLKILDNSLKIAKEKKEAIADELKVESINVEQSKNLKILFFSSLFIAIAFLIVVIVMVVLLLIL